MAFYALLAEDPKTSRWRTCALFPSGDRISAARHAKSLRDTNALGFVPYPTNFRMRVASRREVSLLTNYLNAVDNSANRTFRKTDLDGLLHRRKKLLSSFFLGLFLQPEVMKEKYGGGSTGGSPTTSSSGSGGVLATAEAETIETEAPQGSPAAESNQSDADTTTNTDSLGEEDSSSANAIEDAVSEDGALTDASEQEAALALLESTASEADRSSGGGEIDLDFL